MARTLRQVIEAHLGQVTLDAIEKVVELERLGARVAELEAEVAALKAAAVEAPHGQ